MTDESILVLGATGSTGRRVTAQLRLEGRTVRAASRQGHTNGGVRFDWTDPDTWADAVGDATSMYLMAPHELPVEPEFVDTAVASGIRRIVLLSSRGIEPMDDTRLLAAEQLVRDSGVDWTIVRADWFDQNFDEGFFRAAVMAGELAVPVGDLGQAFVDADDIAAVAAKALVGRGHEATTYEVTGPETLTFAEAADAIGRAAGRKVVFRGEPDAYRAVQREIGFPAEQTERDIVAFTALRESGGGDATDTVRTVTGREPRSFADYAADAAARGAWRDGR
ncbi:NAD(P)H-binding protein [Streptodolium elevatio]|uniref:NAD(P)H-binding protein n=1 Tax=Streptodolium elevatio TaxID=3157996 RepID=A0ABV3DAC9_9ACTN